MRVGVDLWTVASMPGMAPDRAAQLSFPLSPACLPYGMAVA